MKTPSQNNLIIFDYVAYAHIKQGKLEACVVKCMFLGYLKGAKTYRLRCLMYHQLTCHL